MNPNASDPQKPTPADSNSAESSPGHNSEACLTPDQTRCWRAHVFPLILVLTLIWIIYANSFNGTWIFDDEPNIVANPNVHMETLDWESIKKAASGMERGRINRPLAYLSFGLNYFFGGLDPWGYHLVNVIIHSFSAIFLYLLVYELLHLPKIESNYKIHAGSIALLATSLWATHPINVTSITYIVQRMTSLATMFFIITMLLYVRGRIAQIKRHQVIYFTLALLSGFFSLSCKENTAILPLILLTLDLLLIQGIKKNKVKNYLFFSLITMVFLFGVSFLVTNPLTIFSGYESRNFNVWERTLTQHRVLLYYISLIIYPATDRFTFIYDMPVSTSIFNPISTIPSVIFWIIWILFGFYFSRKKPLLSFCLLFYIFNHLIESTILPLEIIYEHRNYLPSTSIFILISMAATYFIYEFSQKKILKFLILSLCFITVAGQSISVIKRNILFENQIFFWQDNAKKSPGESRVHTYLGLAYFDNGLYELARECFKTSIEVNQYPRKSLKAVPFNNLGNYYAQNGDYENAIALYNKALEIDPDHFNSTLNKAQVYLLKKDIKESERLVDVMLTKLPSSIKALTLKSLILFEKKDFNGSINNAFLVLSSQKNNAFALKILGESFRQIGKHELAKKYWMAYVELYPKDLEGLMALLHLSEISNDRFLYSIAATDILKMKIGKNWLEIAGDFNNRSKMNFIVFRDDIKNTIKLIDKYLNNEIQSLDFI